MAGADLRNMAPWLKEQHHMKRVGKRKGRAKVEAAFHEVMHNEPAVVGKTRRKKGKAAARKQKVAIALSKARRRGAKVPKRDGLREGLEG